MNQFEAYANSLNNLAKQRKIESQPSNAEYLWKKKAVELEDRTENDWGIEECGYDMMVFHDIECQHPLTTAELEARNRRVDDRKAYLRNLAHEIHLALI